MKKLGAVCCIALMLVALMPTTSQAVTTAEGRGGIGGFFVGCCLGLRVGADWNEGKDLHWRDLVRFVPYVNYVFGIWDGIECAQGMTTPDLAQRYGSNFY